MPNAAILAFVFLCIVVCSFLRTRRAAAVFAFAVFLTLAAGVPFGDLLWNCIQSATSEGCVWGKSLMPVTVTVGIVVGGIFGAVCWFLALGFQNRRRNVSGATESSHALKDREDA